MFETLHGPNKYFCGSDVANGSPDSGLEAGLNAELEMQANHQCPKCALWPYISAWLTENPKLLLFASAHSWVVGSSRFLFGHIAQPVEPDPEHLRYFLGNLCLRCPIIF